MCDYDGDTEMVLAFTTEEDQLSGLSFTEMVELAEGRSTQAAEILIASLEDWGPPDEPVEFAEAMDRFPDTLQGL